MSDHAELVGRVRRRLVADSGPDAAADGAVLGRLVRAEAPGILDDSVVEQLRREVEAELHGAGPLEHLLADPSVTDVLVNGPDSVWVDRGAGLVRTAVRFGHESAVRALAVRLALAAGRRLDEAAPYADVALPDGTRLHAVLPPLVAATTLSLRVLARRRLGLDELVDLGTVTCDVGSMLREALSARLAMVITGGTGSGKTTLLAALLAEVGADERIVLIEDVAELAVEHPHVVRLVTRAANVEGAGAVGLRELVRQALRMRPDRLIVGEFRSDEMVELLVALNTGHEGGAATMHANSAADVPARCYALGALAGLTVPAVASLVASALDLVVHLRRDRDGPRRVVEVALLDRVGGELVTEAAWTAEGGFGPAAPRLHGLIASRW